MNIWDLKVGDILMHVDELTIAENDREANMTVTAPTQDGKWIPVKIRGCFGHPYIEEIEELITSDEIATVNGQVFL